MRAISKTISVRGGIKTLAILAFLGILFLVSELTKAVMWCYEHVHVSLNIMILMLCGLLLAGCTTPVPVTPAVPASCWPSFPACRPVATVKTHAIHHAGGLKLGDVAAKRRAAEHVLRAPANFTAPDSIDNGEYVSAFLNQGQTPECACYSESAILAASYWRAKDIQTTFDSDAMYRAAKTYDGDPGDGTTLEAVASVAENISFTPSGEIPVLTTAMVADPDQIIYAVHKYGFCWVGMDISENWMNVGADGRIMDGGKQIGGHAVVVVGYSRKCGLIKILNSWGPNWGAGGFCYLSFAEFAREFGYGMTQQIEWRK